jgi:glycosyltransferase involved in cell wall biosynthesis
VPTFSIITPVQNSEKFIYSCLNSVKNQNVDLEHLIQDANSTDSTLKVIKEFCEINKNVKWVSEYDQGQSDALNRLLNRVSGTYIGWLNSDETYLPGTLQKVQEIFEETNADVVYGDCYFVDEKNTLIRLYSNHRFSTNIIRNLGCYIPSCAAFFKAESLDKFRFDTRLKRCMDWDMYLSLINLNFEYIQVVLSTFAVHPNQVTSTPERNFSDEFSLLQVKHSLSRNPALSSPKLRYRALRIVLKLFNGNYLREISILTKSLVESKIKIHEP